ncbi:hypothetical protein NIES4074_54650 [Cylindrospermum sp. NIES-4074]|nr:hypothetical protein NIES4074_54650 [Cylindrospermum sp. NIES-4074]
MVQALPKQITFAEFIEWLPDGERYELHDGVIAEINPPVGEHEDIKMFLTTELGFEFKRLNLPYGIPGQALVKPTESQSAYLPDVLVLNRSNLVNELLWKKESTVTQGASIPLVIEIVSTNWKIDYLTKTNDYEEIGIPEYWIVDYLALGSKRFIGNPKQPTILVHLLVEGVYQVSKFRGNDLIVSPTFPALNLTAEQIFQAGNY